MHQGGRMKSMFTPSVVLTEREIRIGVESGIQRQLECLRGSKSGRETDSEYERKYNSVGPGGLWNNSIEGALGEFAVAKYLGLYPSGITKKDATDVGEHYEVRTRSLEYQELFVKKKDKPDKYYILVQGSFGDYTLMGWITGFEVFDHPEWFHNHNGKLSYSYWVPHEFLNSIETLPKEAPCQKIISSQNLLRSTRVIQFDLLETS
jgi:hypothetical protein